MVILSKNVKLQKSTIKLPSRLSKSSLGLLGDAVGAAGAAVGVAKGLLVDEAVGWLGEAPVSLAFWSFK